MPTAKKIETVKELTDKVTRAKSIVFADYRGLKHKQMEELRRNLKKADGELVVAKNRLLLRALGDMAKGVESSLSESTAALFSFADEVAPLKELVKFFKSSGIGKTKAGILGKQVLLDAEVTRLSSLPPRQQLLGQLVGQLNAPIQGLHYALNWNIQKLVYALHAVQQKKMA